jgi:hypothetical protein
MKTDEQLIKELEQLIAGLLFMSEADYPFQTLFWKKDIEVTDEYLRGQAGASLEAAVKAESVDKFFRAAVSEPDWKGTAELALAKRYQALVIWLKENLSNPKVYRVGEIDIKVYIPGRSNSGNWLGISTRVIET